MNKLGEFGSLNIMRLCPRFDRCSAPICPLDIDQDRRDFLKGEPVCRLPKAKRYAIGIDTPLPRKGMTKQEWAAHIRWKQQNADKRRLQIRHLRPGLVDLYRDFESGFARKGSGTLK